jgi:hypothetical protein
MKSFIVLSIMALSLSSYALDANSSWSEIFASRKTFVHLPQVAFAAGSATSFLSVEKLCYTETSIKTIEAQQIYAPGSSDRQSIVDAGKEILSTSRTYTMMISPRDHGGEVPVVMTIPTSYNITVYAASNNDRDPSRVLFTKVLALPACQ